MSTSIPIPQLVPKLRTLPEYRGWSDDDIAADAAVASSSGNERFFAALDGLGVGASTTRRL